MTTSSETPKRSVALDWILFLITTAILIYMIIFINEWFWVILPFSLTYFVRALRVI